jgi:DNA-binding transcriptional regulator YiaG
MSKKDFDGLVQGIKEMNLIRKGKLKPAKVTKFSPEQVKLIREQNGASKIKKTIFEQEINGRSKI